MPWGWGAFFDDALAATAVPGGEPARVIAEHRIALDVQAAGGPVRVTVPGRLRRAAARGQTVAPSVGDWVVIVRRGGSATVEAVLARHTKLSRKAAGEAEVEQVMAANVDSALIVASLDDAPNLRRIERYQALVQGGGAAAVIVLTKADLATDPAAACASVQRAAGGAPVFVVSDRTTEGLAALAALEALLLPGRTFVLLGPSGVGKSTLVNRWLGTDAQSVGHVRADGKGRHTTTQRSLLRLPSGALVIDTPGMRELGLWDDATATADAFEDIGALAAGCRFRDCAHDAEPGCAVRAAVTDGRLAPTRLESYVKLAREARGRAR